MFQPSRTGFPIAPTPRPYEPGTRCSECKTDPRWDWFDPRRMAGPHIVAGSYDIDNGRLVQVCGTCRRYVAVDHNSNLFLQGNLVKKTREEWRAYRRLLLEHLPQYVADYQYATMRQMRYDQLIEYRWEDHFGPTEVEWLQQQFADLTSELSCCDNYRAARKDRPNQVKRYWKQAEQGCCGSMDVERVRKEVVYLIGCNYGH